MSEARTAGLRQEPPRPDGQGDGGAARVRALQDGNDERRRRGLSADHCQQGWQCHAERRRQTQPPSLASGSILELEG